MKLKPETEWQNFGDMKPDIHGGQFIRYEPENKRWVHIATFNLEEHGLKSVYELPNGSFLIRNPEDWWYEIEHIYPRLIFNDENDWSKGFKPKFQEYVDSESDRFRYVTLEILISDYVTNWTHINPKSEKGSDYWEDLKKLGVDTQTFKNRSVL